MGLGAELLGCALLLTHLHAKVSAAGATCKDVNGLLHETGYHYIPGPEACTLCVCDNGNPTLCKAVFCKYKDQEYIPNKDCKTFRFGNTCCELICLDDAVSSTTNDRTEKTDFNIDLASRIVAFCITSFLIGLFIFTVRLLYQRKLRVERQHRDFSGRLRACSSMGYLDTNSLQHSVQLDDLPCNGSYPLWKPPSNYFPRGEAPPPYEEAVAAARAEQALLSSMSPHTLSPSNFSGSYLTAHNAQTASLVTNSQNGLPASSPTLSSNNAASTSPLISTNNRPLSSPAAHNCYQLNQTESTASDFCSGTCTTSFAVGSNAYENLPTPVNRAGLSHSASSINPQHMAPTSSQLLLPNTQNSPAQNYPQHTTLPRQSGAFTISSSLPNSNPAIHRTIPRTLATSGSLKLRREYSMHQSAVPLFDTPLILPKKTTEDKNPSPRSTISLTVIPSSVPSTLPSGDAAVRTNAFYDSSCARDKPSTSAKPQEFKNSDMSSTSCNYKPSLAAANEVSEEGSFDSVTCTCNVQALPPLHDEADDYRSECENCKSAQGSRYYVGNDDELVTSPHETMTLQRRPEDTASGVTPQYYRTSLTLPTSTRERTRSTSSRSNWFSAMPESSTESSDGE